MARNILVVEDDRNISDLIRMYMEKEGFEVRSAYDGGKAIEEAEDEDEEVVEEVEEEKPAPKKATTTAKRTTAAKKKAE